MSPRLALALLIHRRDGRRGGERLVKSAPLAARVYVAVVCTGGGVALLDAINRLGPTPRGAMSLLLVLSLLSSFLKVEIPVFGTSTTLTACMVLDLVALRLFGPQVGVLVAAFGGWTQCTFRTRVRNPPHQTAFSVASLALAMWVAGTIYTGLGGQAGRDIAMVRWEPFAAAATVCFVLNSGLVGGAVALTTARPFSTIWLDFFFSAWPSYTIGAVLAAAVVSGLQRRTYWVAPILATALALIHRNYKQVIERINDAMIDPVTGLHNQRFVTAHVARELTRARREHDSVALAVFDLDDFKGINDRVGHAVGNRALRSVADALKGVVRGTDVCARYGGDEFVLVMAGCDAADAWRRVDEARSAVQSADVDELSTAGVPLRISAGVAVFPDDGDGFDALFSAADARMNRFKRGNRAWSAHAS
jgi:diguanylate cyclase (GGDEF)-like protein